MTFPRIVHRARRTYWEVAPGVFQATESPDLQPQGAGGYASLAALCALKGDPEPRDTIAALEVTGPGELLTMGDGEKWFHPYSGAALHKVA